jgi:hypothetical protein
VRYPGTRGNPPPLNFQNAFYNWRKLAKGKKEQFDILIVIDLDLNMSRYLVLCNPQNASEILGDISCVGI